MSAYSPLLRRPTAPGNPKPQNAKPTARRPATPIMAHPDVPVTPPESSSERAAQQLSEEPARALGSPAEALRSTHAAETVSPARSATWTPRRIAAKGVDIPHPRVVPPDHASEHQADRFSESGVAGRTVPGLTRISVIPSASRSVPESFTIGLLRQLNRPAPSVSSVSATLRGEGSADLSRARLHRGAEADGLTSRLATSAFTYGRDVFMHRSVQPDTPLGRSILAHEAAHVLQQRGGTEPVIQCATKFTKEAAESRYTRTGTAPDWAKNEGLLAEFKAGLELYLALKVEMSEDKLTVESVDDDEKQKKAMEALIAYVFKNSVVMPRAEAKEGESLYETVDSAEALRRWHAVRDKIKAQIATRGKISTAKGAGQGKIADGNVEFDPDEMKHGVVAAETGWDGFWLITHELLHGQNMKDSKIQNMVGAPKGKTRSFEEVDVTGKPVSATRRQLSFTGEIESYLNVIRIAAKLPLRTTYGDDVLPEDSDLAGDQFINFSYATAPASEGGVDVRDMQPRKSDGVDYPEFVGIRYGSVKSRLGSRMRRMTPGRDKVAIDTDRRHSAKRQEIESWITKLVEGAHAGTLGGKRAEFRFERPSSGTTLRLIVSAGGREHRSECTVDISGVTDDRGLNPRWDGLSIECSGSLKGALHLGSDFESLVDRRFNYDSAVTSRNNNLPVYFNGVLGKKRVKFSVP